MILKTLTAFSVFLFSWASHAVDVSIETDADDCTRAWSTMDVTVKVGDESKDFDPSCKSVFRESFKTEDGTECRIVAGMCSSQSPKNKIVVKCEGEDEVSKDVDCPTSKKK